MSNLKEIRARISSVSSTMKITSAMKMVSAAKLKKSHDRITNIEPYSEGISRIINNMLPSVNKSEIKLASPNNQSKKVLIISISSNRGLCGGFNANIFKKSKELIDSQLSKLDVEFFCIGKKSYEQIKRYGFKIFKYNSEIIDNGDAKKMKLELDQIITKFSEGHWRAVHVVYNKFKNAATQLITEEKLLPIQIEKDNNQNDTKDYIFEPNKTTIINGLLPKKVEIQLFKAVLDSIASEHGARMTAMHKATDNAQELKQNLTLSYNRQRQAAITNEILEIVAGAEALKGV
tara:strand:- start:1771 stop:2640 length:870 start_codon:yes stop_codon:yes gene_type:complete